MIIKNQDDIRPQIDELRSLLGEAASSRQRSDIQFEIDNLAYGARGENEVARKLAIAYEDNPGVFVINDLRLEVGSVAAQIDHLVLDAARVVVLETKNHRSHQIRHPDGSWTIETGTGHKRIESPETQLDEHVGILVRWLRERSIAHLRIVPAVVVGSRATLERAGEPRMPVLHADQLTQWLAPLEPPTQEMEQVRALANALLQSHRPLAVDWSTAFGLRRSVRRKAEVRPEDVARARDVLKKLARDTIQAEMVRMFLGAGGGARLALNTVHGRVELRITRNDRLEVHPGDDLRLKAYVRHCAKSHCNWGYKQGAWYIADGHAENMLATMFADAREYNAGRFTKPTDA